MLEIGDDPIDYFKEFIDFKILAMGIVLPNVPFHINVSKQRVYLLIELYCCMACKMLNNLQLQCGQRPVGYMQGKKPYWATRNPISNLIVS